MQCVSDLAKLRDAVVSRVRHLRRIASAATLPLGPDEKRDIAFVAIELDNLVVVGLRQYTKSSLLRSRTAAGARITASVQPATSEEAAALILRSLNPKLYLRTKPLTILEKDEIVIRDPKKVERVLLDYSVSNLPNLTLALSLNAEVFSEVKICRHFFAHRARNTFESVQRLAGSLGIHRVDFPENFVMQGRPSTGVRILDGWLADVENFFDLAA